MLKTDIQKRYTRFHKNLMNAKSRYIIFIYQELYFIENEISNIKKEKVENPISFIQLVLRRFCYFNLISLFNFSSVCTSHNPYQSMKTLNMLGFFFM